MAYSAAPKKCLLAVQRVTGMPSLRRILAAGSAPSRGFRSSAPARNLVKVEVNGREIEVAPGITVLQACEQAGVDVPRFCYHDRLSIAGNCRMCLVEIEKAPKPVASCAMPIMPGMKIKTETPKVYKAREGVMEFLLANHPLDCPICDQGGECDLQDQAMLYGSDRSRFREWKRTVEDKNIGPLVKTVMTRCIHCTRCVRFAAEVAGVPTLGVTGRGNTMEIGTYIERVFDSELSGNLIDLCPVGALTSKPYAFTTRPWELHQTESIDVFDAVGSNIRIDTRGPEIMRILPRLHEQVNEEWISDKSRFAYDGLKRQRLDTPYVRKADTNEFTACGWPEILSTIREKISGIPGSQMLAIAGPMANVEAVVALKDLMNRLGCENLRSSQDDVLNADLRSKYLFNSSIAGIESADLVLLVGTNPRMEAPLINTRLRKAAILFGQKVGYIGPQMDLAVEPGSIQHLGDNLKALSSIANGDHEFAKKLEKAKKPMVIVGMAALKSKNGIGQGVQSALDAMTKRFPNLTQSNWNGINYLHAEAGRVGQLDVGFVPGSSIDASKPLAESGAKLVYLLGVDDEKLLNSIPKDAFVIYQGHHGDIGASRANAILPSPAYTEKSAVYVNMEGRVQATVPATGSVGDAREDWAIIRALSEVLGKALPYQDLDGVRERVRDIAPFMGYEDHIESPSYNGSSVSLSSPASVPEASLTPLIEDFFMTDPISRASRTMAKCSAQLPVARNSYVKASAA